MSLEMVVGICATQAILGTVPPTPEKAGWHEQTGVGEEDEEDLEELPPKAFMDSDKSTNEDFLDDPDFYSLLDEQGSFRDVGGSGDSTVGTPSQHEAAELTPEGGMQQAELWKERDMRVLNRGLFLLHKAAKLQAAGLARIQAVCRSSPNFGMLLRAFSSVHVPDLTAGALTPQVPMLAPSPSIPKSRGRRCSRCRSGWWTLYASTSAHHALFHPRDVGGYRCSRLERAPEAVVQALPILRNVHNSCVGLLPPAQNCLQEGPREGAELYRVAPDTEANQ